MRLISKHLKNSTDPKHFNGSVVVSNMLSFYGVALFILYIVQLYPTFSLYLNPVTCCTFCSCFYLKRLAVNVRCSFISMCIPVFLSEPLLFLLDEFNRVIIPVKRGEENTDYINASFIDVSKTRMT